MSEKGRNDNLIKKLEDEIDQLAADRDDLKSRQDMLLGVLGAKKFIDNEAEEIRATLDQHKDPVGAMETVVLALAVHATLASEPERVWPLLELAEKVEAGTAEVAAALKQALEGLSEERYFFDTLSPSGDPDDETVYVRFNAERGDPNLAGTLVNGVSLMNREGRRSIATGFCKNLGVGTVEIKIDTDLAQRSPAMALAQTFMEENERWHHQEGMLRIVNAKTPTWAGARGFNESLRACIERAASVKRSGKSLDDFDGLTQFYCYMGATMFDARVMTIPSAQVVALPTLDREQGKPFMENLRLPFEPNMFLDFSADGNLPTIESDLGVNNEVKVAGCLLNRWGEDIVLFTPVFVYSSKHASGPVPLGSLACAQGGATEFWWNRVKYDIPAERSLAIIAQTDALKQFPNLTEEYTRCVERAAQIAASVLYFVESANVESVPASVLFPKRDVKRAEKRGWRIPDTVRVHRPQRRKSTNAPSGTSIEFSHQFMVRGHYKHMSAPTHPHVRCKVCKGKPLEIGCSACNSTGLDPELVKPCARVDITTGELTCPNGCRREWVPEHPKGPEDAPLVLKTYAVNAA